MKGGAGQGLLFVASSEEIFDRLRSDPALREKVTKRFARHYRPEEADGGGHWVWHSAKTLKGYGLFRISGRLMLSHRVAYELFRGAIPAGLQIDHHCRVRACVNPDHLEPVTNAVNCARGMGGVANLRKTCCPQGHPYDEKNTYWHGNNRQCRECRKRKRPKRPKPEPAPEIGA